MDDATPSYDAAAKRAAIALEWYQSRRRQANYTVLPFGGCLIHQPLKAYGKERQAEFRMQLGTTGGLPLKYAHTHTVGEMIQLVRVLRQELTLPPEVKHYAGLTAGFEPSPGISGFQDVDVVMVEPNTPMEIVYDSHLLQTNAVKRHLVDALRAARPEPEFAKKISRWLAHGLMKGDEAAREVGVELANLVPDTFPQAEFTRDVLINARGIRRDVLTDLRHLREIIERPMVVVTFTFRFMPDGRPIGWPAGFSEELLSAAKALDLPVMEPWKLVVDYGVANALQDHAHYTEPFNLVMGEALMDFARAHA